MMNREFAMINGNNVDVTTVMDKTIHYIPTETEIAATKEAAEILLTQYFADIFSSGVGLDTMFDDDGEFWKRKGWIISAFQKHPLYNGNLQIVLKNQDMCRHQNGNDIDNFCEYVGEWFDKNMVYRTETGRILTAQKRDYYLRMVRKFKNMEDDYSCYHTDDYYREFQAAYYRLRGAELDPKMAFVKCSILDVATHSKRMATTTVDEELVNIVKSYSKTYEIPFNMHEGEKITRLILKLAKMVGINNHTDIQDTSFVRQDGEVINRTKDIGWNYQYARFCDAITPMIQKGTLIVSVNPIDYWTMSFGKNWASCHTIDKNNTRPNNGGHHYSGCYCGGTESYMLDDSSIIVYSLPNEWDGEHPEYEDKVKRCVFYLGEDKLIQSRVYPDGRDGGEASLAGDIRKSIQKLVSELWDVPNYWTNSKGTCACEEVIDSYGVHYRDYEHYSDCNVSFMKRIDGHKNVKRIRVGHDPICPECGATHYEEKNIFCEDCQDQYEECFGCGSYNRREDMHEIDGRWYCSDCVIYCDSCQEFRPLMDAEEIDEAWVCRRCIRDYYTWSDYEDRYISDSYVINTEEGRVCEEGGEGYFHCERCDSYHNIENLVEFEGQSICPSCMEEINRERENESDSEEIEVIDLDIDDDELLF